MDALVRNRKLTDPLAILLSPDPLDLPLDTPHPLFWLLSSFLCHLSPSNVLCHFLIYLSTIYTSGFPGGAVVTNLFGNARDADWIPG